MAGKRIAIVAYHFPPYNHIASARVLFFANGLAERGYQVTVFTEDHKAVARLRAAIDEEYCSKVHPAVDVVRIASGSGAEVRVFEAYNERKKAGRAGFSLTLAKNAYKWLRGLTVMEPAYASWLSKARVELAARASEFDLLLTSSPPYGLDKIARAARKANPRLAWAADFRDNWTTNPGLHYATPLHRLSASMRERRLNRDAEIVSFVEADFIPQPTPLHLQILNGFDPEEMPDREYRRSCRFSVAHFGSLYSSRSPGPFLRGLAVAIEREPEFAKETRVSFFGSASGFDFATVTARDASLGRVVEYDKQLPRGEALALMAKTDLLLLILDPARKARDTVYSGKLFEYLYSGRPILAVVPRDGAAADLIEELKAGAIINPGDSEGIAEALLRFWRDWKGRGLDSRAPSDRLMAYSRERQARRLFEAIEALP